MLYCRFLLIIYFRSSRLGAEEMNPTRNHEVADSISDFAQWVGESSIAMSCGVGRRRGLDLVLLWLWHRPAAKAPIGPLAWELPYATSVALKKKSQNFTQEYNSTMGVMAMNELNCSFTCSTYVHSQKSDH